MNEASPREMPNGTAGRPRLAALFSALLLCVLFAAGAPRHGASIADATRIELGERRARASLQHLLESHGVLDAPLPKNAMSAALALPRVLPRTRSIEAGGLPPPRAPTS